MNDRPPAPGGLALVQSLVNSMDLETRVDLLSTEDGRAAFGLAEHDVPAARALRRALRTACLAHAGIHPRGRSVADLDELLAGAPLRVAVGPGGEAALRPATASDALLPRVAEAIAEASADGTWNRLKACEAEDCHWAFYDRSPAGRGRWCSMSVCGARAKMRAYRARLMDGGGAPL
ncbi:CGNR zinc finger domain-containing protein [Streptomyces sp. NPDC096310]|uniref:CGNR zinc finger domain-containing protein n=1 Tax=Streptomyces sp. NPDC096310 TaxID=3366082 RepID=UPI003818DD4E